MRHNYHPLELDFIDWDRRNKERELELKGTHRYDAQFKKAIAIQKAQARVIKATRPYCSTEGPDDSELERALAALDEVMKGGK